MKIILDEKTGTAYRYFNSTKTIAFTPRLKTRPDGVEILDTNEGGIVEVWEDPADEQRIRALLDN